MPTRILIVEDDPDIADLVARYLDKAGYITEHAATGRDALQAIAARPPGLLVLDLMLPHVDGLEICRLVRANEATAAIPVIILTARADESERIVGLELGADDYLAKPFSPNELVARVRAMLRRAQRGAAPTSNTLTYGPIALTERHVVSTGWPTRAPTRPRTRASGSTRRARAGESRSRSPTRAPGFPTRICRACSSGSTASTSHAPAIPAAPASASPSSSTSSSCTGAGCAPRTARTAARGSPFRSSLRMMRLERSGRRARGATAVSAVSAIAVFILMLAGCTRGAPKPATPWTLTIEPLPPPANDASAQPQLTASKDGVILSWLEHASSQTALRFSERTASGWSEPRLVAFGDDFFSNYADVPSVIRLSDRTLVAHWLRMKDASASGYDLRLARSSDEGRSWSVPFPPHHDGTNTQHGFASLFDTGAGLGLIWLDGRAMTPGITPDDEGTGDMGLRAAHFDRSGKQLSEDAIDRRVCECCPTAAAVTTDGPIVAYRNRSDDEVRDIFVSRFTGEAWTVPAPVHADGWKIDGCPVNGPAIGASGRNVAVAWFTAPKDEGHALVAFSQDAGRTFGAPVQVDDAGSLGRVDVAPLADGSAVVGWIERAGKTTAFKVRRIERSGQRSAAVTVTDLGERRNSGYPRMARLGQDLIFAWADADGLRIATAIARLP